MGAAASWQPDPNIWDIKEDLPSIKGEAVTNVFDSHMDKQFSKDIDNKIEALQKATLSGLLDIYMVNKNIQKTEIDFEKFYDSVKNYQEFQKAFPNYLEDPN